MAKVPTTDEDAEHECGKCDANIAEDQEYCHSCGGELKWEEKEEEED